MYKVYINQTKISFVRPNSEGIPLLNTQIYEYFDKVSLIKKISDFLHSDNEDDLYIIAKKPKKVFKKFKKSFKMVKASGCLVKNSQNDLLLIKRLGMWDLPKGHMEKGEKKKEAALRECTEETGVKDLEVLHKLPNTYHMYPIKGKWVCKVTYWYLCRSENTHFQAQSEEGITEVVWKNREEIESIKNQIWFSLHDLLEESRFL